MNKTTTYICRACNYEKNAPKGICLIKSASDGLPIRCVGKWSKEKHYYLKRYIDIFTKAMRRKWHGHLNYIDLFTGPGKCRIRNNGEEIDGSPLIAIKNEILFEYYFFVEKDKDVLKVLEKRCENYINSRNIFFLGGDCNRIVDSINKQVPKSSLSLVFIDPTGLDITFSAIKELTFNKKMDLIIIFPEGMAINRNIKNFLKKEWSKLDDFIGNSNWRKKYYDLPNKRRTEIMKSFIGLYRKNLESIGYTDIKIGNEILIKSNKKHLPLYYLLFASKHPLGDKFWKEITRIEYNGKMRLFQ